MGEIQSVLLILTKTKMIKTEKLKFYSTETRKNWKTWT